MNDREIQIFLDEAEIILHGIRGGILLFAQSPTDVSALDVPARRINELRHRSEPLGRREVADACAKVSGSLTSLIEATQWPRYPEPSAASTRSPSNSPLPDSAPPIARFRFFGRHDLQPQVARRGNCATA